MLSVITLVRDRNLMLANFLRGWQRQVGDIEVVVVRAGGEQDPGDVAVEIADIEVSVVELDVAPGDQIAYSSARNLGAARSMGEHLVFADADTIPCCGFAAAIDGALRQHDALLTGDVWYLPPDATISDDDAANGAQARPHPNRPVPPTHGVDLSLPHEMVWGLSMAMRRPSFELAGGFDEHYDGYAGEDTDLAVALRELGRPAGLVAGARVLHQHHDSWEPPLHQLPATVANARRFRSKWGRWPMEGWLGEFERLGLVELTADTIDVVRIPTAEEIDARRQTHAAPFRR